MKKYFETGDLSLRRRFILYIVSLIAMILALIILLLNLFGALNPSRTEIENTFNGQLQTFTESVEHDYDNLAAFAISFAHQMEDKIQAYLVSENLTFDQLHGSPDRLNEMQDYLYDTVYLNMQLAPSSGAFYFLDASVDEKTSKPSTSCNGIYLKYINLYSENTVNNKFTLYRGSFTTGKNQGINFHSGWQSEIETDFFQTAEEVFSENVHYVLTSTMSIPETWEKARYVYVPIRDVRNNIIGVCGFEINDLFFQLKYDSDDITSSKMIRAMFDNKNGSYTGQFSANAYSNSSKPPAIGLVHKGGTTYFDVDDELYVGKTQDVKLGKDTFTLAVMMTENQYLAIVRKGQTRMAAIFGFVAIIAFVTCYFMSKQYVSPILKKFELIKGNHAYGDQIHIREIDDLLAYLEEKDLQYEAQLAELEEARKIAEEEAQKKKVAYESALSEYDFAQAQIDLLYDMHREEIVLEEYTYFVNNLNKLTPTEYKVYELYLEGKKAKDIQEALSITENTLKYHNKNIYSKLGITSRKQLLKFAEFKKYQDEHSKDKKE